MSKSIQRSYESQIKYNTESARFYASKGYNGIASQYSAAADKARANLQADILSDKLKSNTNYFSTDGNDYYVKYTGSIGSIWQTYLDVDTKEKLAFRKSFIGRLLFVPYLMGTCLLSGSFSLSILGVVLFCILTYILFILPLTWLLGLGGYL